MKYTARIRRGLTVVEVLVTLLGIVVLTSVALPSLTATTCDKLKNVSIGNLQKLNFAHALYAADWNDRQVTWTRDDLGVYDGDPVQYNLAHRCADPFDPGCQPPVVFGLDCDGTLHAYDLPQAAWAVQPINFPGPPHQDQSIAGIGTFRFPNARPFHDYVNGRVHDPVFYAPKDATVIEAVADCLDSKCEFDPACSPGWSSYALSPAAMFNPEVLSLNEPFLSYWRAPWDFADGYESPSVSQAKYPAQKTRMIEHSWLQNPPVPCSLALPGCEPYYFNQGFHSVPMTLFYDGSVDSLSVSEALDSQARLLVQSNTPLWSSDTPFGDAGYFIGSAYDFAQTSYHILTVDGIRGRDTLK